MKNLIVSLSFGLMLVLPGAAYAQEIPAPITVEELRVQLIALLQAQVDILLAQLVELKSRQDMLENKVNENSQTVPVLGSEPVALPDVEYAVSIDIKDVDQEGEEDDQDRSFLYVEIEGDFEQAYMHLEDSLGNELVTHGYGPRSSKAYLKSIGKSESFSGQFFVVGPVPADTYTWKVGAKKNTSETFKEGSVVVE